LTVHRGLADNLFLDVLARHLQLYYEDPDRKDIPVYNPIDKSIMEKRFLNMFPIMDAYSPIPCFNFPKVKPTISNGFTSIYYARHDRFIITVMNGCGDIVSETAPLVASAIAHSAAYLTQIYNQKKSKDLCSFISGFNELRASHIPGYSGLSLHQICNIMQFASSSPHAINRTMFLNAYKDRICHKLPPEERMNGVCSHSLDINFQIDLSSRTTRTNISTDCGRLTNIKSWHSPVASGAMVVDIYTAPDLSSILCSFQVSHTIPAEIREQFTPLLLEELSSLELMAFDISCR
jgi:hypothetical protein